MFMLDVGVGETWNIIAGNDVAQSTAASFTGGIDMVDRVVVALMAATIATGVGLIGISRRNPAAVNQVLSYAPWLGLAIGLTSFSTEVMDVLAGDFDWASASDAYAGQVLAVTGWVMSGVANFFRR
jgi:hypothetical protein